MKIDLLWMAAGGGTYLILRLLWWAWQKRRQRKARATLERFLSRKYSLPSEPRPVKIKLECRCPKAYLGYHLSGCPEIRPDERVPMSMASPLTTATTTKGNDSDAPGQASTVPATPRSPLSGLGAMASGPVEQSSECVHRPQWSLVSIPGQWWIEGDRQARLKTLCRFCGAPMLFALIPVQAAGETPSTSPRPASGESAQESVHVP